MGGMAPPPRFRTDLYRGTAAYYHRYRTPYPASLVADLAERAGLDGTGRLLDLACGPGRVTFALAPHFAEVVAVDQEEDAVRYAEFVAAERGAPPIRWEAGRVEDLHVEGEFDLVTIGDAFHRLDRRRVAALAARWLRPGGHIALLWTTMPWQGGAAWQKEALEWVKHWMHVTGSLEYIPADLARSLVDAPHTAVLADAGFEVIGSYEFTRSFTWTVDALVGFAHSTSIMSVAVLGDRAAEFERDLRDRLLPLHPDGRFVDEIGYSYDLAVNR
jgi:SAM-dependent methyltransferase